MTTTDPQPRHEDGTFGSYRHTAPESELAVSPPLTDQISDYLKEYEEAAETYESEGEGYGSEDAYEAWEDFRTDNAEHAANLLEEALKEITRLNAELARVKA